MAEDGEIERNGAIIRIDANGGVQVEPATGEDTTVDSDLIVNGDAPGGVDISDDGTVVVATASDVNFGTNLSVFDDGDGTATVDSDLSGKADDPHDNSAHSETYATTAEVDAKADDPHGNAAHSETFAVDGDEQPPEVHGDTEHDDTVPSQSDVDAKADDPHDNSAHSETFAVDGDTQPPEEHDNTAHSETYATTAEVDAKADDPHGNAAHSETFAVDGDEQPPEVHGDTEHDDTVPSQSDVDAKADDPHGNEAHSNEFTEEIRDSGSTLGGQSTLDFADNLDVSVSGGVATINASGGSGDGAIALEEYATAEDVPAASEVTQPTIAYVADVGDGTDDYIGVFNS